MFDTYYSYNANNINIIDDLMINIFILNILEEDFL